MGRKVVQFISLILQNSNVKGFAGGEIYRGNLKHICVPGLNCYSCPGAVGSCPIGSLQAISMNAALTLSLYIYGFLSLVGIIAGRFVCGYLCPFGLIQELLFKIPIKIRKLKIPDIIYKLKYVVLGVLVIGIPTILTFTGGISFPAFCAWLCPAGTLQAGIPLVLFNERISDSVGALFTWKIIVLAVIIIFSILILRPFCRILCPLGAIYSLFNKISIIHINTDEALCNNCNCCKTGCHISAGDTQSLECIRCGSCVKQCPAGAKCWSRRKLASGRSEIA